MPQCSDYGPGWVGEHPNCSYDPSTPLGQEQPAFTGTVGSLGFESLLPSGEDWSKYFDPYDPTEEEMATRSAGIDIGQLQSAWDQQSGQLTEALGLGREQQGETWRLQGAEVGGQWEGQQQQLGAGARRGYQDIAQMGEQRQVQGRGLMFGEQRQRQAEEEVSGAYKRSFGLGQSAYERAMETGQSRYRQGLEAGTMGYEQAMETGELALQQGTTDIYQALESNILGGRQDWRSEQRGTLNMLLGMGLEPGDGTSTGGTTNTGWVTCCDGSSQPAAYMCGLGNQPQDCYAGEKGGTSGTGDTGTGAGTGTGTGTGAGTGSGTGTGGSGSGGGGGGCFIAGTLIQLPSGAKSIEDIKVGDVVTSFDVGTSSIIDSEVTKTYVHSDRYYMILNGSIKTTSVHPFYCDGKWVEAGDLSIGDKILHVDGLEHTIETIELSDEPATVYNFEVDGTHNYFAEGYLVHNKTTLPPWS